MQFEITHQDSYSRGELLLRSFFGWFYILIPHAFLLMIFSFVLSILTFAAWWVILITGNTPEWYYSWSLKLNRWSLRVSARLLNLSDGYPAFGMDGQDDNTTLNFEHIHIGRGQLLLRSFLGWLMLIPHIFVLYFRMIGTYVLVFLAWWVVLFTGNYPANWHTFNTGTLRWSTRLNLWYSWLIKDYPPFSGAPDAGAESAPIDQM
ncbi:MAG: DUF4389 domain-containing protein [Chitinophagales bacterium]|nr:DUF4389 domain-containing protein [Chitinophagales bacterium]MCB9021820.1 DUF4389 domain-containing protein [Chitinophagales bacterium]MCB9030929.1 DUF4389 domain-containing protein [Chitinophagales bacterium]HPE96316.1 DUF4389 domain-containing protein [Chitinophagales bacterium]HPR30120.1 DUF4389 domain-containing protein [Chitinophagales bacterium]